MSEKIKWKQEAINAINAIAEKLGQGVDHFYPLLVKRQMIEGPFLLAGSLILLATSFIWCKWAFRQYKKCDDFIEFCPFHLFVAIPMFFGIALMYDGASHILIPEYHVLKEILEMMK